MSKEPKEKNAFSDDDLKRFHKWVKDYLKHGQNGAGMFPVAGVIALLARLEAAENPARGLQHNHAEDRAPHNLCRRCEADETWRKAAGK